MRLLTVLLLCAYGQVAHTHRLNEPIFNAVPGSDQNSNRPIRTQHRHRHSRRDNPHGLSNNIRLDIEMNPTLLSSRVSFSSAKPETPPWLIELSPDDPTDELKQLQEIEQARKKQHRHRNIRKGKHFPGKNSHKKRERRSKRSAIDHFLHVPVCQSVSNWVERTHAEDLWGNTVQVLQEIDIGGARVNQYFYETYCREENTSCIGIDTSQYMSMCKSKHVWAYARIRTSAGDEGWNLIKIRGSCNCALYKVQDDKEFDIFGLLGKR